MNEKTAAEKMKQASVALKQLIKEASERESRIKEINKENGSLATKNAELSGEVALLQKEISANKVAQELIDDNIIDYMKKASWVDRMMKASEAPAEYGEKVKAMNSDQPGEEAKDTEDETPSETEETMDPDEKIAKQIVQNNK